MLKRLYICNFAIVDELEIKFEEGFQVITGETGAGKSILVINTKDYEIHLSSIGSVDSKFVILNSIIGSV